MRRMVLPGVMRGSWLRIGRSVFEGFTGRYRRRWHHVICRQRRRPFRACFAFGASSLASVRHAKHARQRRCSTSVIMEPQGKALAFDAGKKIDSRKRYIGGYADSDC